MNEEVTLTLPIEAVNEILDNLYYRLEVWNNTVEWLESGCIVAPCYIESCTSVSKARKMVKVCRKSISLIEEKFKKTF